MMTQALGGQLARFFAVGALNAAFGYAVFALLVFAGLAYPIAIAIATIAGILFNFQSTGRLVFGSANSARLWRFFAVYAVVYLINVGGVAGLLRAGLDVYAANALLVVPLAMIGFFLNRKFVFGAP